MRALANDVRSLRSLARPPKARQELGHKSIGQGVHVAYFHDPEFPRPEGFFLFFFPAGRHYGFFFSTGKGSVYVACGNRMGGNELRFPRVGKR